jgi:uncharacterized protein YbcI
MERRSVGRAEEEIRRELVQIHEESYGAGITATEVYILDTAVLVILDVELTPAERTLLDSGKVDAVRRIREDYQEVIGSTFIAVVERATGRRVTSWVSRMHAEGALYSVELFRLAPS